MASSGARRRLQPADRRRLADQALESIRAAILSGQFAMGERLIETELAADLDMSRAPIREALRRLSKDGLVVEDANRGTSVAAFSASDVVDLYNVRLGLEIVAVRLFMLHGSSVEPLHERIDRMRDAARKRRAAAVVQAELDFHREIAAGARSPLLLTIFEQLQGRLQLMLALDDAAFANLEDIAEEHEPVVAAIESGDQEHAVRIFEEHLVSTVGTLLERLGGSSVPLLEPRPVR